jgi:ureidoglycolate dehydrogenase (NAD+)
LRDLKAFKQSANRTMVASQPSSVVTLYDFNGNPGIAFLKEIVAQQSEIARAHGVAIASIKNSSGVHQLSSWVAPFAEQDLVAYFRWNGGSYTTVPHGSRVSFFGTNPIAYAIPTDDKPILCDMSTSEIPYLGLNYALNNGLELNPGEGLDAFGAETLDPNEVYNPKHNEDVRLLPLGGGYKGSAIMLLSEVLTGALVGAKMSREASDEPLIPEEFGGLLQVFDPSVLSSRDAFKASVSKMAGEIRRSETSDGHTSVRLPGDSSYLREAEKIKKGSIEIDPELVSEFENV